MERAGFLAALGVDCFGDFPVDRFAAFFAALFVDFRAAFFVAFLAEFFVDFFPAFFPAFREAPPAPARFRLCELLRLFTLVTLAVPRSSWALAARLSKPSAHVDTIRALATPATTSPAIVARSTGPFSARRPDD